MERGEEKEREEEGLGTCCRVLTQVTLYVKLDLQLLKECQLSLIRLRRTAA
jgi:hypothetical protein